MTQSRDLDVEAHRKHASRLKALSRRVGRLCQCCGLPLSRYNRDRFCGPCAFGRR